MKEKILALRAEGKSYNEIVSIIGCSKGTVSYYCGEGQKEKSYKRNISRRDTIKGKIHKKVETFFRNRIRNFKRNGKDLNSDIDYNEAFEKILSNPICYLTGREINFEDKTSYHLDHIIPSSKGGENSIKNMALASRDANLAKNNLSLIEFINLCKEVLEFNGFKVENQEVRR